jgi:Predicted acyltransferases
MNYRADIGGLRGIAVLLVILFHAGVTFFPSGFIGVDVFFVISGFLISGVIQTSLQNNTFSFKGFYTRRLWRLQPAMLVMLLFTLIIASIFFLPDDYSDFLKSARRVLLATVNQYFAHTTTGYAAPDSDMMLLLHMWSLSIEWQWYLFFPLIFVLAIKFLKEKSVFISIVAALTVCTMLSFYMGWKHPEQTYYFFLSRAFEFILGVLAFEISQRKIYLTETVKTVLTFMALVVIVLVAMMKDVLWGYPNYWTLVIATSTAMMLAFGGSNKKGFYNKITMFAPLVYVGDISYSLYLFHWPIFAALHYIGYESTILRVIAVVASFVLASLTYALVEKPLRKTNLSFSKSFVILVIIPGMVIYGIYSLGKKTDQFSYLRFGAELARVNKVLSDTKLKQREECMNINVHETEPQCVVGSKEPKEWALLMGDSHSNQYWNFFDILGKDADVSVDMKATSLCLAFPGIYQYDFWNYKGEVYQQCHDNVDAYYKEIQSGKYKYVIISEVWENYALFNIYNDARDKKSRELSIQRITKAAHDGITRIVASGATPVIVKSMYPMPRGYLTCFYEHFKTRSAYMSSSCNPEPWQGDSKLWTTTLFKNLQQDFPSLIIIDPKLVQCDGQNCKTEIDGIPLYRDVGHLNDYATKILGEQYVKQLGNPLAVP